MASRKEYLEYILDQLSLPEDVSCRAMMGEYILYYRGRIVGGIYDDRLLVKQTPASLARLRSGNKPSEGRRSYEEAEQC